MTWGGSYVQILFYVVLCRRPLRALQQGSATALPWVTGICRGNKLQALMDKERCFLDDSLSLSGLAEKLNLSSHHLSQLLNEHLHMPFYDCINTQRIEYAKQLLREQPARAIIDIACASGYDNKGTFYRVFKRNVGMTPAQYRSQSTATPDGSTTRSD